MVAPRGHGPLMLKMFLRPWNKEYNKDNRFSPLIHNVRSNSDFRLIEPMAKANYSRTLYLADFNKVYVYFPLYLNRNSLVLIPIYFEFSPNRLIDSVVVQNLIGLLVSFDWQCTCMDDFKRLQRNLVIQRIRHQFHRFRVRFI